MKTAPAQNSKAHLRVRNLRKSYGSVNILKGMSFDIQRGRTTVIMGPSGSGKSVLLRQLIRLEKPDSGEIWVDDVNMAQLEDVELFTVRQKFGMVFQMAALFDSMSVFDNVAFPLREHSKMSRKEIRDRVMDRLSILGIEAAEKRMPSELSGGMAKRVALARALVLEPEILFYDEPTTGLDPVTSRTVDKLIEETSERFGVTSVVVSHDMASVVSIADDIKFLYQGKIAVQGSVNELLNSENEVLRELFTASGVDTLALAKS